MATAAERIIVVTPEEYESIYGLRKPLGKRKTPGEMFDAQANKLMALDLLTDDEADHLRRHIPDSLKFLLVPHLPEKLDLSVHMKHVILAGKTGKNYLDVQYVSDVVDMPKEAHLLLDTEDGRGRLNTVPSVSRANIERERRHPYTLWHGIIHGILFPDVLQDHNLDLVGSRYLLDGVPALTYSGAVTKLSSHWSNVAIPGWGAPSAGSMEV